jgi:hypothetical protein
MADAMGFVTAVLLMGGRLGPALALLAGIVLRMPAQHIRCFVIRS